MAAASPASRVGLVAAIWSQRLLAEKRPLKHDLHVVRQYGLPLASQRLRAEKRALSRPGLALWARAFAGVTTPVGREEAIETISAEMVSRRATSSQRLLAEKRPLKRCGPGQDEERGGRSQRLLAE